MRARAGLTLLETVLSLALFLIVMLVALGALDLVLREHFTASTRASVQRNLLEVSALLSSEARCSAFIYGENQTSGTELVFTNNFQTRTNPPVLVQYRWDRKARTMMRLKVLMSGRDGPFLVGSGITDLRYEPVNEVPALKGARLHLRVGDREEIALESDLLLVSRAMTSRPIQGGYYSPAFWVSFWQGWPQGLKTGRDGG